MDNRIVHIISGDLWGGKEAQLQMQLTTLKEQSRKFHLGLVFFNPGDVEKRFKKTLNDSVVIPESKGLVLLIKLLRGYLKKTQPGVIVTHGYKEALVAFLSKLGLGIPLICTFHGLGEKHSGLPGFKNKINNGLHRFVARFFSKRVVTVSKTLAGEIGLSRLKKLRVIFNCAEAHAPAKGFEKDLVIVGRLVKIKRVDLAIRLWAAVPEVSRQGRRLTIVGEGPEKEELVSLAKELLSPNCYQFLGFREDAGSIISGAAALLLTSEHEGIPTVVLEAINSGTPAIATNVGGLGELQERAGKDSLELLDFDLINKGDFSEAVDLVEKLLPEGKGIEDSPARGEGFLRPTRAAQDHQEIYGEILAGPIS